MKFESDEFGEFTNALAKKLTIVDLRSLFNALDAWPYTTYIGNNAFWNWRTVLIRVPDDTIEGDEVILVTFEGNQKEFRKSVVKHSFPSKDFLVYIYETLTQS